MEAYRVIGIDDNREVRLCSATGRVTFGPRGERTETVKHVGLPEWKDLPDAEGDWLRRSPKMGDEVWQVTMSADGPRSVNVGFRFPFQEGIRWFGPIPPDPEAP